MTSIIRSCVLPGGRHDELSAGAYACPACQLGLVRRLADIETYLSIITPEPVRSGSSGPTSRQYGSREPLRLDIVAMLDPRTEINGASGAINPDGVDDDVVDEIPNIEADLGGWLQVLNEQHPDGPWWLRDNQANAALLRSRCDWICQQPWVDEFAADIARVHSALRAACRDEPQRPVADCPCGGQLYRRSDDPVDPRLRCSACGTTYDGFQLLTLRGTA